MTTNPQSSKLEASRNDFALDHFFRTSSASSWLQMADKRREVWLQNVFLTQTQPPVELHDFIRHELLERVRLVVDGMPQAAEDMWFHKVFGWVVTARGRRACLGKIELPDTGHLEIGPDSYLSGKSAVRGSFRVSIGSFTAVAESNFWDSSPDNHPSHLPSLLNFQHESRWVHFNNAIDLGLAKEDSGLVNEISIGNDVWLGRGVRVCPGVTVADGCIIAENSLLRSSTQPYGIYAGSPAKLKKFRFSPAAIEQLMEICWWSWPLERIYANADFFSMDLSEFSGSLKGLVKA